MQKHRVDRWARVGEPSRIRTSASLVLALVAASCLACAKGAEISPEEIVVLQALPPPGADAGADAATPPNEPAEAAPVATDTEP